MEPMTMAAMAGSNLLASLMQAEYAKQEGKKNRELQGMMAGAEGQQQALQKMDQGTQDALAQLMAGYRSILG